MKARKTTVSFKVLRMIAKNEPGYVFFSIPHLLLSSVLTLLAVYFPKHFIEQLENRQDFPSIATSVGIYIGILIMIQSADAFFVHKTERCREHFSKQIRLRAGEITMELPLANIEGASFGDKLAMANHITQIMDAFSILQSILISFITIAGLSVIISKLDIVFLLTVAVVLSVKVLFVCLTYRYRKKRRVLYGENDRIGSYLENTAYFNQGAAKELRIDALGDWFMKKIRGYREKMLSLQYEDFGRSALFDIISAILLALQSLIILVLLAKRVTTGEIGIAEFTMYFSAVATLTATLSSVVTQIGDYSHRQIYLSDFEKLSADQPIPGIKTEKDLNGLDIVFEDVWFAYPNTEKFVLKSINFRIAQGEKLSVVGQNGAGKTTFIKLLCRFYRPTRGRITLGGIDIHEIEEGVYRRLLSAVFQDFQNFPFTVEENIAMGKDEMPSISSLGGWINRLPAGVKTYVTRNFEADGVELSGGEGQKLSILRAVHKHTPILILDEPTASLDPMAECEIYDEYFNIAKDKTTIFISHRLASSTIADHVVLFENGQIAGYGSHEELIKNCETYAQMFALQRSSFKNEQLV